MPLTLTSEAGVFNPEACGVHRRSLGGGCRGQSPPPIFFSQMVTHGQKKFKISKVFKFRVFDPSLSWLASESGSQKSFQCFACMGSHVFCLSTFCLSTFCLSTFCLLTLCLHTRKFGVKIIRINIKKQNKRNNIILLSILGGVSECSKLGRQKNTDRLSELLMARILPASSPVASVHGFLPRRF